MSRSHLASVAAVLLLSQLGSGALAQTTRSYEHDQPGRPDGTLPLYGAGPRQNHAARPGGVSTTPDHQILVELAPEDTTAANLLDLDGMTLGFTPDGQGGYSRSVQALAW